ncbi:hypothetical protein EDB84DRAFT_1550439 [Lactarius hengduanensis]|nr:hypothetical protein EDB84DRAFT_1550439 [Lactarius hengduanensis]
MVCVTFRICALAIATSSSVSLTSVFSPSSRSVHPATFLRNLFARLCCISFVAVARISRISTVICTILSVIAGVSGTSV